MKRKNTTLADIAQKLGISSMTVSRAINGQSGISSDLQKIVLKTAMEMKYVPSRSIKALATPGNSLTVGVIVPHFANTFYPSVIENIEKYLSAKGYRILLCCSYNNPIYEFRHISSLLERKIDGIIWSPASMEDSRKTIHMLQKQHCPLVFLDRLLDPMLSDAVVVDDRNAMTRLVRHLAKQGYSRPAYLNARADSYVSRERLAGFMQGLEETGLQCPPEWILPAGSDMEAGCASAQIILSGKTRPDALVCFNDPVAMGVEQVLLEAGVDIPGDIGITGFSGVPETAMLSVPITTVMQNTAALGTEAARMLLCRMLNPSTRFTPMKNIIKTRLELRSSTLRQKHGSALEIP